MTTMLIVREERPVLVSNWTAGLRGGRLHARIAAVASDATGVSIHLQDVAGRYLRMEGLAPEHARWLAERLVRAARNTEVERAPRLDTGKGTHPMCAQPACSAAGTLRRVRYIGAAKVPEYRCGRHAMPDEAPPACWGIK